MFPAIRPGGSGPIVHTRVTPPPSAVPTGGFQMAPAATLSGLIAGGSGPIDRSGGPPTPPDLLLPMFERAFERFVEAVTTERLFLEPIDREKTLGAFRRFLSSGGPTPLEDSRVTRNAVPALPRMVRAAPAFESLPPEEKERFFRLFPEMPREISAASRAEVEAEVERLLPRGGEPRTTMILGVGRDYQTVEECLRRGDRVILADHDPEVIRDLKNHFLSEEASWDRSRIVFEETEFDNVDFLLRYAGKADLVYFFYTSDYTGTIAIVNLLKGGGLLVSQQIEDDSVYLTERFEAFPGEFSVIRQFKQIRPAYETPWSKVFPSANTLSLVQRRPDSRLDGRVFFHPGRRLIEAGYEGSMAVTLCEVVELLLEREGEGVLKPFLQWFLGHADRHSGDPVAYLQIHLGLLYFWLKDAPGVWPPSEEQTATIIRETSRYLHIDPESISEENWQKALAEMVDGILPRQLAVMEEELFEKHRAWIQRFLPPAVEYREGLARPIPMQEVRAAMAYEKDRDHTVFFLGPGPSEEGLIRDALRAVGRTGAVHLVETDRDRVRQMENLLGSTDGPRPVFDKTDYTDERFLSRYEGKADRVVVLYPNRLHFLETASRLLREGGRLVFQHVIGSEFGVGEGEADRFSAGLAGFKRVVLLKNVRPVIRTKRSSVFPAGNLFLIADKK